MWHYKCRLAEIMETRNKILTAFNFLIKEYGYILIKNEVNETLKGKYLAIFRNDAAKIQLEISADESYFHCEFRRIMNGEPAKYNDKENCIGFESLARLESNNNYDHYDYYVGLKDLQKVLNNTVKLFNRHKNFLTSDNWIDIKKIEQLKDDEFEKTCGRRPDRTKPSFFNELKKQAMSFLLDKKFTLTLDSDELAPYDWKGWNKNIIFTRGKQIIKISQHDFRDAYFYYYIEVDSIKQFEIDKTKYDDIFKAVDLIMQKLKKIIK
jgi:hypothetical protein